LPPLLLLLLLPPFELLAGYSEFSSGTVVLSLLGS
jgi:hypothetical protein